ncbi:hypothetical protein HKBW3S42_00099 [Candidatus Hakubella thermalkaliphila]|uniref:Uncharacterized protein n=1 Tax=Candidatus Hakubella thermalkaliphila TaxID=2754717 RepID=A0A6V8PHN5_9ACTN|nr:hypothetical protein HKBW3S42_00099 [Candidatus Hakubella thermalkaliphila]
MSYYDDLNQKSYEIERFINTFPLLSSVFTPHFFEDVRAQIEEMRRLGLSSSLHSMFIFFRDDSENGYQKTRRLEDYLTKIFSHCSTGERNYIKSEFTRLQCLNTLFEVSILGNLLYLGYSVFPGLMIAFVTAALTGLFLILTRKKTRKDYIPFAPHLVLGAIISLFWGTQIMSAYKGLF